MMSKWGDALGLTFRPLALNNFDVRVGLVFRQSADASFRSGLARIADILRQTVS